MLAPRPLGRRPVAWHLQARAAPTQAEGVLLLPARVAAPCNPTLQGSAQRGCTPAARDPASGRNITVVVAAGNDSFAQADGAGPDGRWPCAGTAAPMLAGLWTARRLKHSENRSL